MYVPTKLKRWTRPDSYFGAEWPDYYRAGVGQSRDSSTLERSNFVCMLHALGGESETVIVVREGHWAVGWIEWIAIHESDAKALETTDGIAAALEDYPVVDEMHWSDLEYTEMLDYWGRMDSRERAEWIMGEVERYHWIPQSLMRYRRLLRPDYSPGSEEGLSENEAMVSRALEEHLRHA